jgi:hypothetical protein
MHPHMLKSGWRTGPFREWDDPEVSQRRREDRWYPRSACMRLNHWPRELGTTIVTKSAADLMDRLEGFRADA